MGCYRDPGEASPPLRGKCCQSYLSKVLTLVSMLVNNQGLVAVPPQPHQSIKQVPVNSYIPVIQVSCYVFSFGANKRGSPHNSTPVCCLLGLGQCDIIQRLASSVNIISGKNGITLNCMCKRYIQ